MFNLAITALKLNFPQLCLPVWTAPPKAYKFTSLFLSLLGLAILFLYVADCVTLQTTQADN